MPTYKTNIPIPCAISGAPSPGRVTWSDFVEEGCFRVPALPEAGYKTWAFGCRQAVCWSLDGRGLFMDGHPYGRMVGEVLVPDKLVPWDASKLATFPVATMRTPFGKPAGVAADNGQQGVPDFRYEGLQFAETPTGPKLFWSIAPSWGCRGVNAANVGCCDMDPPYSNPRGPWNFAGEPANIRGGYMGLLPDGRLISGRAGQSGAASGGWGPIAIAIRPWLDDGMYPAPLAMMTGQRLLYFPYGGLVAGGDTTPTGFPGFRPCDAVHAAQVIGGALVFSVFWGFGAMWFLNGSLPVTGPGGVVDTVRAGGFHAPPWDCQLWWFDLQEVFASAAPNLPRPYAVSSLLPHLNAPVDFGPTIAYHAGTGRLAVVEPLADTIARPIIHVFRNEGE